jgi:hypothetical protein
MSGGKMSNPHLEASEHIASAVSTLPADFRGRNVEVLYQILYELGRSHTAQLQMLGPLRRLDLTAWRTDLVREAREIRINLQEISDTATLDRWRTHCHNLQILGRQLVGEGWAVTEVQQALGPLYVYDGEFIDQLEGLVAPAVAAARRVEDELDGHEGDDGALQRARNTRDRFIEEHRQLLDSAKSLLIKMGDAARQLTLEL